MSTHLTNNQMQTRMQNPRNNNSNYTGANINATNITNNNNNQMSRNDNGMNQNSSTNNSDSTIVGLHYKIGKKIGEGSFGVLFEGINMINGLPVAIKFEPKKTEAPQLKDEYRTYKIVAGTPNIPHAYYFGQEGLHNILVIDLLGPSLEDLFDWCNRKFSVKTVVQIAVQMITLIEDLHAHDLIYRDIKPDNFLIGRPGAPDENNINLIDFGMAKQYRDPKTKQHIPYREKKSLSGTARYMSINTHLGREQSRRDDMESLGHVFFYFLRGQLPWQGLKAPNNKQKYEKIGEKKRSTNVYDLAQGFPIQFGRYLEIVRNLSFDETPDYEGYRKLLLSSLDDLNMKADGEYDWMKLNGGHGWDASINKKPNLHGYGHPNPPNGKSRRHRDHQKTPLQQLSQQQQAQQAQQQAQQQQLQMQQQQQQQQQQRQQQLQMQQQNQLNAQQQQQYEAEKNRLDPTSFEAYKQQTQQRYSQQQQKLKQQQMNKQREQQYAAQQQQNMNYQQQQMQANQPANQPEDNDSLEKKGFFAQLGCC